MGLEFKIISLEGEDEISVNAESTPGNKNLYFETLSNGFNVLDLTDILELGVFLNHKIGFELVNIREVEREIEKEKKLSEARSHEN